MVKMQAGVEGAIAIPINSPLGQKISLKSKNNHKNSKKAFSVAEAMIALLIGSVALGMAAPMITKQIKAQNMTDTQFRVMNSQFERLRESNDNTINALIQRIEALEAQNIQIDEGMIAPFALANCPTGWTELTKLYKGADGAFIRNIGGNAKAMSELQNDAAPNLTFQFDIDDNQ